MTPVAWIVEGYDGMGCYFKSITQTKPNPDSWVSVTPLYADLKEITKESEK